MKIERVFVPEAATPVATVPLARAPVERWPVAGGAAVLAAALLLAVYWPTVRDMIVTWEVNATYAHGYMILPLSAWLVWRQRDRLATLQPAPDLRVLPLFLVPGIAWLLGELASVKAVQQFALVSALPLIAWAVLGRAVFNALAFPLAFLFFAVPFGEFMVPVLMQYTADFTVLALQVTGVAVYREGLFFSTPGGNWSVVEACSGLRYLIACFTGGVLYAYLRYRSFRNRAIFVALSALVPIVANGLRAYLIVMLDYVSGGRIAADVDHILYGWVFFCMVTLLLFWIGSLWREDHPQHERPAAAAVARSRIPSAAAFAVAGGTAALTMIGWPALAEMLDAGGDGAVPQLAAPRHVGDWQALPGQISAWTPQFQPPSASLEQAYTDGSARAALYVGYYADQKRSTELVSSLNALAAATTQWRLTGEKEREVALARGGLSVIESQLHGPGERLLVWRWYWVDGIHTASPYWAKLVQLRSQLMGRGDDGAVIVLYTQHDGRTGDATARLAAFADAVIPAVTRSLYHAH